MHAESGPRSFGEAPGDWLIRIGFASSTGDVVELAREYCGQMTETERMRLPSALLPPPMKSPKDVNDYALNLARAQVSFNGAIATRVVLDRLTVFFASVSSRISQLEHVARAGV